MATRPNSLCECLSGNPAEECCAPLHAGAAAPTALALMRSRYCAFARLNSDYLLATWHPSTLPGSLELDAAVRWYRLDILDTVGGSPLDTTGIVEFEAFYRGGSQRERSRFVREGGRWYYLDAAPRTDHPRRGALAR